MDIFNGVTTWVEGIIRLRGFTPTDAGTLGALMLVGGVAGAVLIPPFCDRQHRRQRYILLGFILAIPGLLGVTFACVTWLLYAAEVTNPTPEGTSNGLIQLFGQASVVFVYLMEALKTRSGAFTPALLLSAGLLLLSVILILKRKDPMVRST